MQDAPDPTQDGQQDSGPGAEQARPANNLPLQLTSFVGREREMAEVEERLAGARLLTLTGPGGSGKTRLALAVAAEVGGTRTGRGSWNWPRSLTPSSCRRRLPPSWGCGRRQAVPLVGFARAPPRIPGSPAGPGQLRASGGRPAPRWPRPCCVPARTCESSPPAGRRSASPARPLRRSSPFPAGPTPPSGRGEPATLRGGQALRRAGKGGKAGLRAHGGQRDGGGPGVLPPRRDTAGHRACGGKGEGALGGADLLPPGRSFRLLTGAGGRLCPTTGRSGRRWTGATSCSPRRSKTCSEAIRVRRRLHTRSRGGGGEGEGIEEGVEVLDLLAVAWWTSRWCWWRSRTGGALPAAGDGAAVRTGEARGAGESGAGPGAARRVLPGAGRGGGAAIWGDRGLASEAGARAHNFRAALRWLTGPEARPGARAWGCGWRCSWATGLLGRPTD